MTISRDLALAERQSVWERLSVPIAPDRLAWRQDGKISARDGKYFARFVVYIEANTVRERLDSVVAGEWDLQLELLPQVTTQEGIEYAFKARLQILGDIRENVGQGRDYKAAATDAFKRAAVQFGIGSELYDYEQNWVEMDGDGKYAKPVEDPQTAYMRRYGGGSGAKQDGAGQKPGGRSQSTAAANDSAGASTAPAPASTLTDTTLVTCPVCGGQMWDRRKDKKNPRAPDFACQNRSCKGAIWPERAPA